VDHRPLGIGQRMQREIHAGFRDTHFEENPLPNFFDP
jgi:hypothetical protein